MFEDELDEDLTSRSDRFCSDLALMQYFLLSKGYFDELTEENYLDYFDLCVVEYAL